MAKKENTYEEIIRDINDGKFAPVYVLMGEEPYFIDKIEGLILQKALADSERDFNQTIFYGEDSKPENIINAARRYPLNAKRQVVVVREAQELDKIETLSHYMKAPMPDTVLVLCYKYGKIEDSGKKSLLSESKRIGIVYESKKIYDNKMPDFIQSYMQGRAIDIDKKSVDMLSDYLGTDISRLEQETDKLMIVMQDKQVKRITPDIIEKNIGISKDYNSFELINAIAAKDVLRANRIAVYFDKNHSKNNAIQKVLSVLFNYFVDLMICIYSKDKTAAALMQQLGIKWNPKFRSPQGQWDFQYKYYQTGLRNYSGMQVYNALHEIRLADARSKGVENNNSTDDGDIYKELLYKIMH